MGKLKIKLTKHYDHYLWSPERFGPTQLLSKRARSALASLKGYSAYAANKSKSTNTQLNFYTNARTHIYMMNLEMWRITIERESYLKVVRENEYWLSPIACYREKDSSFFLCFWKTERDLTEVLAKKHKRGLKTVLYLLEKKVLVWFMLGGLSNY